MTGFIDINARFGPRARPDFDAPLATLREQAARHGVTHSLAFDLGALHVDPIGGNNRALEIAADPANHLSAVAVIPANRLDLTTGKGLDIRDLVRRGAKAVRLGLGSREWHTGTPETGLRSAATRAVLEQVARAGVPLMIPVVGWGDASTAGEVTKDLGIPVVLVDIHYIAIIDNIEALRRYPHLSIDISRLATFRAIEDLVREIGHERVFLGSENPDRCLASPLNAVLAAQIPDDAKRAILRDNAVRVFGLPTPDRPLELRPPTLPTLPQGAFDVHCHYNPSPWPVPQIGDHEIAPALGRLGTGGNVASPAVGILSDVVAGNLQGRASADPRTGQFTYAVADPWDFEQARAELRSHLGADGVIGVKVHAAFAGMPTSDPRTSDLFALLADYGRPVKIHNEGADWDAALGAIARRHPRLPIIVAHAGLGRPSIEGARLAASTDNVYLEMGSSYAQLPIVREIVRIAPRHKLLYGTDAPLLDPAFVLGTYIDTGLIDDPDVMGGTARRLFGV